MPSFVTLPVVLRLASSRLGAGRNDGGNGKNPQYTERTNGMRPRIDVKKEYTNHPINIWPASILEPELLVVRPER